MIWLSFLALVSESLKLYYIKNVGISEPISWPPESDPCCLEHEGLAILRTQIQCLLSSLFALWKWINLTSVGNCSLWQSVVYVNCSAWLMCYDTSVRRHHICCITNYAQIQRLHLLHCRTYKNNVYESLLARSWLLIYIERRPGCSELGFICNA